MFSEYNTTLATDNASVLYRRGSDSATIQNGQASGSDEEFGFAPPPKSNAREIESVPPPYDSRGDMFSWYQLNYSVPVAEGERVLLNNVMGYVAPGKLTALMGESGAGKVSISGPPSDVFLLTW